MAQIQIKVLRKSVQIGHFFSTLAAVTVPGQTHLRKTSATGKICVQAVGAREILLDKTLLKHINVFKLIVPLITS
jgi:hypothetical protein